MKKKSIVNINCEIEITLNELFIIKKILDKYLKNSSYNSIEEHMLYNDIEEIEKEIYERITIK